MRRYCSCQDASLYTRDKYGGGDTLGCSSPSPHPPNWLRPAVSSFFAPFRPPSYYYSNNKNYTFS